MRRKLLVHASRSLPACTVALLCALCLSQSLATPPSPTDMARRTLACTGCHAKDGQAGKDAYYPRIAGKPAQYLYNQLLNFRDERRQYPLMANLLEPLSERYLQDIALHFSQLDVPYAPRPVVGPQVPGLAEGLVKRGDAARQLPACMACHGVALTGVLPNVPGLLGLPRDYLNAQLGAWRTGQRRAHMPDCMERVAKSLQSDEISAVTAWLAVQPVPTNARAVSAADHALAVGPGAAENLRCGSGAALRVAAP